jgi:hypothetical protein
LLWGEPGRGGSGFFAVLDFCGTFSMGQPTDSFVSDLTCPSTCSGTGQLLFAITAQYCFLPLFLLIELCR